jgi:tripartite-type tricarboxylate transporter receptor subunit TctC
MSTLHEVAAACTASLIAFTAGFASAQEFPNKPIRIVTGAAGGGSDFGARLIAQGISASLGQQVIVDNRGGIIPNEVVSKSPPDGYTLLFSGQSLWIVPLMQSAPYDPIRDFSPVAIATSSPNVLVVHPSLRVKSVKELIALARSRPGELNYGSGAAGSAPHLAMELFKNMAGLKIVWVPYKGVALAFTDLLGGQLQVMFPAIGLVTPHIKAGRVIVLAVTSAEPTALIPGYPTVAASGLPGFVVASVDGVLAPAKTPAAIINRLNQEIVRYLNTADAKKRFFDSGGDVVAGSAEEFAAIIKSETAIWGKVIKEAGIRTE